MVETALLQKFIYLTTHDVNSAGKTNEQKKMGLAVDRDDHEVIDLHRKKFFEPLLYLLTVDFIRIDSKPRDLFRTLVVLGAAKRRVGVTSQEKLHTSGGIVESWRSQLDDIQIQITHDESDGYLNYHRAGKVV